MTEDVQQTLAAITLATVGTTQLLLAILCWRLWSRIRFLESSVGVIGQGVLSLLNVVIVDVLQAENEAE